MIRDGLALALLLLVATSVRAADGRTEVIVYYASETAPEGAEAKNYEVISGWFRASPDPFHHKIADQFAVEPLYSQAAVAINTVEITHLPLPAVLFTNRMTRQGKCLVSRPDSTGVDHPFAVPSDPNYIVAANPLAKASTLAAALATAADVFPPDRHVYLLVTQGHGSPVMAVTPRLAVRHEETTREELLARASPTPTGPSPAWGNKVGITKPQLLEAITAAGRDRGMHLPLVYVEACHTEGPEFTRENLPPNADRLMHIRHGAWRVNVLYLDVQQQRREGESFADALVRTRSPKFEVIERTWPGWRHLRAFPWVYLSPLAVWFLWLLDRRWLARRAAAIPAPNPVPFPSNSV